MDFPHILCDQKKRKKRLFVLNTIAPASKSTGKSIKVESQSINEALTNYTTKPKQKTDCRTKGKIDEKIFHTQRGSKNH